MNRIGIKLIKGFTKNDVTRMLSEKLPMTNLKTNKGMSETLDLHFYSIILIIYLFF